MLKAIIFFITFSLPGFLFAASDSVAGDKIDLTSHSVGYWAIAIFVFAYILVIGEEFTHLRKSKPVVLAAGIIWMLIAYIYVQNDMGQMAEAAVRHNFLEFTELMMFLLVAMTYINAMAERNVFQSLRSWLVSRNYSFRKLFWITGILAFFISPIADNLTTALLMGAVVLAVGGDNKKFVSLACINIVVSANAGGAFSPFGDITTLMVWQAGEVKFATFFALFVPSVVNYLIPATIMHFAVPNEHPTASDDVIVMKRGARRIMGLFLLTIATAVSFHNFLHLPPVIGMMTGLGYLQFFSYYIKMTAEKDSLSQRNAEQFANIDVTGANPPEKFDIFRKVARAEWDTLFFFYGVVLCVGGLGFIGYLAYVSQIMYIDWGPTNANIMVGILSAIVDNIPVMFAVLTMDPDMSLGQWLLATLTAGVGGSMLSIGSAAGVALMGQAHGKYTFFSHLKWTPVIALGYFASIWVHLMFNASYF